MASALESYAIKVISDPFVSGVSVFYTLTWIEYGEYRSSIYRLDGKQPRRLTFGGHEKKPVLKGGKLYYISYSEESESLSVLEEMSEPRELYRNRSITKFLVLDSSILLIARDFSDESKPMVVDRLKYRFDTKGYLRTRTKIVELKDSPEDVVAGEFDIVDIATDGERVVFTATIEDDDRGLQDVYELDLPGKNYRRITEGSGIAGPVCVGDNGEIAYIGHRKGLKPWASNSLIFPEKGIEVPVANGAGNTVNSDLFVSPPGQLLYDRGGYYTIGQEGGSTHLYRYNGENLIRLTEGEISVRELSVNNGDISYVFTSHEKPSILVFGEEYDPNPEIIGRKSEKLNINGMDAWLMYTSKENPTVLAVHGGPHTAYGNAYSIEFNFLADNGFNVLFGNPRGSDGYGEKFAEACVGNWGVGDFDDLLGFVDHVINARGLVDIFAITGGSYGGYMTNAAIVRTDRFRCAISERCVSNLMSMCGTSDIGFWFNLVESGVGDPWSDEGIRILLDMSPVTKAHMASTPTLFIHGEEDYRCPIEQSEQMYSALKMNGVETVLARYPGDSHEHARHGVPNNMVDRLERKLDWLNRHMRE